MAFLFCLTLRRQWRRLRAACDIGQSFSPGSRAITPFSPTRLTTWRFRSRTVRLRDERQLGYKMPKYIMRIDLVENFTQIGNGNGGYWEDQGYEWWAGI